MGDDALSMSFPARFKNAEGMLTVEMGRITWAPLRSGQAQALDISINDIQGQQRNKAGAAKPSARFKLAAGPLTFEFPVESDRDQVIDMVKPMLDRVLEKGKAPAEAAPARPPAAPVEVLGRVKLSAERQAVLTDNLEMQALYDQLVGGGVVTDAEFWRGRDALVEEKLPPERRQRQGYPTGLVTMEKKAHGNANEVTFNVTPVMIDQIFAEKPAVERAYHAKVPKEMTKQDFWQRYCTAEYVSAEALVKSGGINHQHLSEDLAKLLEDDDDEFKKLATTEAPELGIEARSKMRKIDPTVNLAANFDDCVPGGFGVARNGAKESEKSMKVAEAKVGSIIHDINRHGQVVVTGRTAADLAPSAAGAGAGLAGGGAGARGAGGAGAEAELDAQQKRVERREAGAMSDLIGPSASGHIPLSISDPRRYFQAASAGMGAGAPRAGGAGAGGGDALDVKAAVGSVDPHGLPLQPFPAGIARDAARDLARRSRVGPVLGAGMGAGAGGAGGGARAELPAALHAEFHAAQATGNELLRHFWACFRISPKAREPKLPRIKRAMDDLYDRLEARKGTLPPEVRGVASQLLRPLLESLDAAHDRMEEEENRKKTAALAGKAAVAV